MRELILVAMGFAGLGLGGCYSPSFEKAWRNAGEGGGGARWLGAWQSHRHAAGGGLRGVMQPPRDGRLDAFFEARWMCFRSAYRVDLAAEPVRGGYSVFGDCDLKSLVGGGVYRYTGSLLKDRFEAQYESAYDSGLFRLEPAGSGVGALESPGGR